jgi:drug/metabolite transporter (DMT)-like permease
MDKSSCNWVFSARWARKSFLFAVLLAAGLCLGALRRHEPITWIELLPFAGCALVIVGIGLAVSLKKWTHGRDSEPSA